MPPKFKMMLPILLFRILFRCRISQKVIIKGPFKTFKKQMSAFILCGKRKCVTAKVD
jgi:hypothetical protein